MNIRQLTYLVYLAKEQHFTRAAEACNVSQPALSGGIRKLEEELGIPIILRDHNYVGLTEEGQRVLVWAEKILAHWDAMKQDVSSSPKSIMGSLRMGAIPTTVPIGVMLTARCMEKLPSVKYELLSMSNQKLIYQLDHFELDIGLTYIGNSKEKNNQAIAGFRVLPIYQERYVLLTRKQDELAKAKTIDWISIEALPLCLLSSHMQNRQIIDSAFRENGITPNLRIETDSIFSLCMLISQTDIYSVVPHSMLALSGMYQDLAAIPIAPTLLRDIGLIIPDRQPLAPVVERAWHCFAELELQAQLDALISKSY